MFTDPGNGSELRIGVTLISSDSELQERVSKEFSKHNSFDLTKVQGNLNESEEQLFNGALQPVIIVELDPGNREELATLERLKESRLADRPIIILSEFLEEITVRRLLRMRVSDWLPKISPASDIVKSCERALQISAGEMRTPQADVYAFFPASGGVGNSTLAIQCALLLSQRAQKKGSTCLVDLNLQTGSVADYLNLKPVLDTKEIIASPERLDKQLLEVMLSRHESGLAVLAAPKAGTRFCDISEEAVASVLGLTSEMFDNVVVDLPQIWFPWTNNVAVGSNRFFIVSEFTVPSLRHARLLLDAVRALDAPSAEVSVIVNKFRQRLFGGGLAKKDATQLLHDGLAGFVPDEISMVREAINRGEPLSDIQKSNSIEKALGRILKN